MKRASIVLCLLGIAMAGIHSPGVYAQEDFTVLFDGSNLDNFNPIGDANWEIVAGVVQADSGGGFLVTKESYADFHLTLDFWVDEPANSGIFVRCADAASVNDRNSYEVNIYDTRARPDLPDRRHRPHRGAGQRRDDRRAVEQLRHSPGGLADRGDAERTAHARH